MEPIKMIATIPTLQSWMSVSGDEQEGSRVKFDFPASEMAQVARLLLVRGKVLELTVTIANE